MEHLYELSRGTLLLDFRQPPGSQLAVLIKRIFDARAVALFDASLGRQDRIGEWRLDEEDIAKDCFLINAARDNKETQTSERILRVGVKPVGALVAGRTWPAVIDGLAALAALAMERHQSYENEDRAEAAKRSEQLRAAVMDALAHEFKTPLTAVQTASSGLLELGGLTVLQGNLVRLIDDEAVRLNELCTRLLKTAKLNPEQVDLETNEVKVRELLSSVLASQPAEGGGRSVQISMEDPELTVRADRGLLELILKQYISMPRSTWHRKVRLRLKRTTAMARLSFPCITSGRQFEWKIGRASSNVFTGHLM